VTTLLQRAVLAGAILGAAVHASAAEDGLPELTARGQALLFGTHLGVEQGSFLNPGNRLAGIPDAEGSAELRLDLMARWQPCRAQARLRGRADRVLDATPPPDDRDSSDAFLNAGSLRCRIGQRTTVLVGREVEQWGSAFYLSPSNPFFFDTGRTDPVRELYGKDIWQLSAYLDPTTTLSLTRNYRAGPREPERTGFSETTALRLDWIGQAASGGLVFARRDDGIERLGAYGTWTYSSAWLFYTDLALARGHAGWFARPGGEALSWHFERSKRDRDQAFYSVLMGAGYTFESGWTATAEWLTGNEGYDSGERSAYDAAVEEASRAFAAGGPASGEAAGVLVAGLSPGLPYLARNTLFLQLARNEWNDKADVALRWTQAFGSGSGASLSFSATYYLTGHLQAFAIGSRNVGGVRTDFGRLVRDSLSLGFRYYF